MHIYIHKHTCAHVLPLRCVCGIYSSQIHDGHPAVLDGDMSTVLQLENRKCG